MLSTLENQPANSPVPVRSKDVSAAGTTCACATAEELFSAFAVGFLYDKKDKSWKDIGEGRTVFSFDRKSSAVIIKRGSALHHKVSITTRVKNDVSKSQSWVFRAEACNSDAHEVLCLQLPEGAASFVTTYESHRIKCLESLKIAARAGLAGGVESCGNDLSAGFRALTLQANSGSALATADGAIARRRLSVAGNEPNIDGYAEGARYERPATASPTVRSPLRPSSAQAKTLRGGQAGETAASVSSTSSTTSDILMSFSGISVKGKSRDNPDKQNQDALLMHQLPSGDVILSVFDGHGENGHNVSNHFKTRIPQILSRSAAFADPKTTSESIAEALTAVEREIVDDVTVDTTLSGSTGVMTVLRGDKVTVANVGDSRAIFGVSDKNSSSKAMVASEITQDHKPDLPHEQKRIQEVGGRVFAVHFPDGIDGPPRVWLSYADLPGLAMSRSFGDTIAKEAGVISEPDLFEVDLQPEHKCLVVASDGLWEFMTNQEVIDIVSLYASPPDPQAAITALVAESTRRWNLNEPVVDDTSIIVAFFQPQQ